MKSVYGYCCQVAGQPHCDGLKEVLRAESSRLFPGLRWGGMFLDAWTARCAGFYCRFASRQLILRLRPGDTLLLAELFHAFRRSSDARNMLDFLTDRWGVNVVALDVNLADGEALAAWERSLYKRRAVEEVTISRAFGRAVGRPPIGFKLCGGAGSRRCVPDKRELNMVQEVARLGGQGLSRFEVARRMMLDGWRSPRTGREFSPSTVQRAAAAHSRLVELGLLSPLTTASGRHSAFT